MAEEAAKTMEPNVDLLEWPKKDKRRLLHAVYSASDLERTIKRWGLCLASLEHGLCGCSAQFYGRFAWVCWQWRIASDKRVGLCSNTNHALRIWFIINFYAGLCFFSCTL